MGRRSMDAQVNDVFKESEIFTPGESKHIAKEEARANGACDWHEIGKEMNIYSYRTAEAYKDVWHDACNDIKAEHKIYDLKEITGDHIANWLESKIDEGISKSTFQQYAAALEKFDVALDRYSEKVGYERESGEISKALEGVREYASDVLNGNYQDRAFTDPRAIIENLSDPSHKVFAEIQLNTGCRFDSLAEKLKLDNLTEDGFKTWGKGGHEINIYGMTPEKVSEIADHLKSGSGKFDINYKEYLNDIKNACKEVGEDPENKGTHSFRWNFAVNDYNKYIEEGYSPSQAEKMTANDMSHERSDITRHYLGK